MLDVHLNDNRLHEDLYTGNVELLNHVAQRAVILRGGTDHERISGGIGSDTNRIFEIRVLATVAAGGRAAASAASPRHPTRTPATVTTAH